MQRCQTEIFSDEIINNNKRSNIVNNIILQREFTKPPINNTNYKFEIILYINNNNGNRNEQIKFILSNKTNKYQIFLNKFECCTIFGFKNANLKDIINKL